MGDGRGGERGGRLALKRCVRRRDQTVGRGAWHGPRLAGGARRLDHGAGVHGDGGGGGQRKHGPLRACVGCGDAHMYTCTAGSYSVGHVTGAAKRRPYRCERLV